jgi:hypothetical protein
MKLVARTGQEIIVDDDASEFIRSTTWNVVTARNVQYARFSQLYLHRLVIAAQRGVMVDHINGNGLDNRRSNLRLITHQGNKANSHYGTYSSRFVGVSLKKDRIRKKPWSVFAKRDGRVVYVGSFAAEEDAARAYDSFVREVYGDLAVTNF